MASQGFRMLGALLLGSMLLLPARAAESIEGVRTIDLPLRSIVFDPVSTHLFGTSPSGLLQIDSSSGAVLRTFPISPNLSKLELGAERGLLMGIDGEGAIQRFNLETLAPEGKIVVRPNSSVLDISASKTDPYTMAASFGTNRNPLTGTAQATAYIIRNGTVLPDTVERQYLSFQLETVYATSYGIVQRLLTGAFGLQETGVVVQQRWEGDLVVHNGVLYHAAGLALRIDNFRYAAAYLIRQGGFTAGSIYPENLMALNLETEELLFFSKNTNGVGAVLNRFSLAGEHRGQFTFPVMDLSGFMDRSLASWGTNRAAFNTTQQLYLLELDKVFRTFDLGILDQAIVPSAPVFGQPVELITTFTNQGGTAFNVAASHSFPESAIHIGGSLGTNVEVLPSGSTFQLRTTVLPGQAGEFTAGASVQSTGETGTANNSRESTVTVAFDPSLTRIPFRFFSIGSDPVSGRLAANENGWLWVIDPKEPRIHRLMVPHGGYINGGAGAFYSGFTRVDSRTLEITNELAGVGPIGAVSSVPGLVAIADGTSTFLARDGSILGGRMPGSGNMAFNEDATLLYRLSIEDCVLDRFRVTASGLVHEQTRTNSACTDYVAANGLVYFDSGVIYDSFSGQRRPESFGIFPPAYVAATTNGEIALLSRTNSIWVARLFRGSDLSLLAERQLPFAPATVLEFASLGGDYVALRGVNELQVFSIGTAGGESLRLTARRGSGSQVILTHGTVAGTRYRWERADTLGASTGWAIFGSETIGTGAPIELVLDTAGAGKAFFRVTRLP